MFSIKNIEHNIRLGMSFAKNDYHFVQGEMS